MLEYHFCGLFLFKGKLYLGREEKVGGPRLLLFPLKELPKSIEPTALGAELLAALGDYRDAGRSVPAPEWAVLNQQLLAFFGETSMAAFERKKKDVTIRKHVPSGEIRLSGARDQVVVVSDRDPLRLGGAAKELLRI